MSGIIKVFLLMAAVVYISNAQLNESGQCLCQRVRNSIGKTPLKDIQIYPATTFCNKVEIVVTANNGLRFCLNPKMEALSKLLAKVFRKKKAATATPTATSGTTI